MPAWDSLTVAGGGSWGTALANHLANKGYHVNLWLRDKKLAENINSKHENTRYLSGFALNPNLVATSDVAVLRTQLLVLSIPCQKLGEFLRTVEDNLLPDVVVVNTAKGFELATMHLGHEIVHNALEIPHTYAVLSGPSFAKEVLQAMPTAVVIASKNPQIGGHLLELFSNQSLRCYYSDDVTGVEAGGALKNIIAIACGICAALHLGTNSQAALITRALAEMQRIGVALGARPDTFMGLSGMGDLILTSSGDLSRNRQVGLGIGRGKSVETITRELGMVAEGVATCRAVHRLILERKIDAPICEAVYEILETGKKPLDVLSELMTRNLRHE
ncbi:MAG: NAD(P)-dependent glycerol-3-phosphate dehydrogenase [Desulfovibrionaceae bacterium]|nr:NAD(P)-dependent glycerol-3-phosphate dehydrogenase [Desulfovibrionaceae bacterium]